MYIVLVKARIRKIVFLSVWVSLIQKEILIVMKILFDLRKYQYNAHRGIGRYISSLIEHIIKNNNILNVYHKGNQVESQLNTIEVSILIYRSMPTPIFYDKYKDKINIYYYEKLDEYDFVGGFDFWFFDDLLGFLERAKSINNFFYELYPQKLLDHSHSVVGILHDFIPLVFAKDYLADETVALKYLLQMEASKIATHYFTNSECTKNDGIKYLEKSSKYFTNIYGGADESKFTNSFLSIEQKNNTIICIVDGDKRKNAHSLIRAFGLAYNSGKIPNDAKLYIAPIEYEQGGFISSVIKESKLTDANVIRAGFISDSTLITELSNARASIFPSLYEGLGLPIIESYSCGTAAFASNRSSTNELVDSECSFNPYDIIEMSELIMRIYNDDSLLEKSINFGMAIIKEKVNWDIAATKVIDKLIELQKSSQTSHKDLIETVVFAPLPPQSSRLASVACRIFGANESVHLFSNFDNNIYNYRNALKYNEANFKNNFYFIDCYNSFKNSEIYKNKIFVFSNSYHSVDYLSMAINEFDKNNSYLFVDKNNIFILIYSYLESFAKFKDMITSCYPKISEQIVMSNNFENLYGILISHKIYGIKILAEMTAIKNIIFEDGNIKTKERIISELQEYNIVGVKIYNLEDIGIEYNNKISIDICDNKITTEKRYSNKQINLLFCTRTFIDSFKNDNSRAGVFFVSYNILQTLRRHKNINITLYLAGEYLEFEHNIKNDSLLKNFELVIDSNKKDFENVLMATDIYFSCYYDITETIRKHQNIKIFHILHDTMPITFNEYFPSYNSNFKGFGLAAYMEMLENLNRDTYYLCTSDNTKIDFITYFSSKLDESKMFTTYWAASDNFYTNKDTSLLEATLQKYNVSIKNKKFIFSLCTIEPRKNLIFTIKCFLKFIDKHNISDLYFLLGGAQWDFFIKQLETEIGLLVEKHKNKIIRLGYVDDNDLPIFYSNSILFTYISQYEGFGLPLLEAMKCSTPIITSNNSSIPEVVGDSAIMIDYNSESQCVKALEDFYFDESLRNRYIEKGLAQASLFGWDKTISGIIDLFYHALKMQPNN